MSKQTKHGLPFSPLDVVRAMNADDRTIYFERFAQFIPDSPLASRYGIKVGSHTLFSDDTLDLRIKFDNLIDTAVK